ncbi:metallophosphoesterase [Dethiosulfovibrio salsuginis]|uniref:Phosphoesterase n=1 Tax=Dethiosulfovibrio salsuginis TaxID=561720 RepID=A0A1X7L7E2_9BACT|nr:metallophosphoesterase [Dethiosulfovibrio salsuginis]SMG49374.1 hypothetical protein SAMN06275492_1493 [Dethiosulfovibrio salsuginis]
MARIGVISDTHGDLHCWQKARGLWGDLEMILHCGDVLSHPETEGSFYLAQEIRSLSIPFYVARGNCDRGMDREKIGRSFEPTLELKWMGRSILMAHGHDFSSVREIALLRTPNIVLTGHTHIASLVRERGTIYMNPGSASAPRGRDPASIAIITEEDLSIVTLEGFILHRERW